PREQWHVLIRDAHPAYISWQEYERNEQQLQHSARTLGFKRHAGPAREGSALLQGKAVCGLCGSRMNVHYNVRKDGMIPNYVCVGRGRLFGDPLCQSILGTGIDAAVGQLLARISQKLRRKTLTEGPKSSVNGASYQRVKRNPARRKESAANE